MNFRKDRDRQIGLVSKSMKNYFIVSYRYFFRDIGYSLINVFGLAIGMAFFLIISVYVLYETSFDHFHERYKSIYRLGSEITNTKEKSFIMPEILTKALRANIPQIFRVGIVQQSDNAVLQTEKSNIVSSGLFVDENFLQIFTFPLREGSNSESLSSPNAIILSDILATALFGHENPVGKTIKYSNKFSSFTLNIVGIAKAPPADSHLKFDYLISVATLSSDSSLQEWFNTWDVDAFNVYVELLAGQNSEDVSNNITILLRNINPHANYQDISYFLQPIVQIHLRPNGQEGISLRLQLIIIYFSLALAILFAACINSINLSTARASKRIKEISIRKIIGAFKSELILQFLAEALFYVLIAMSIAMIIFILIFSIVSKYLGTDLSLQNVQKLFVLYSIIGTTIFVSFSSGIYPAFFLASLKIGNKIHEIAKGGKERGMAKNALIVVQFTAMAVLMIMTFGVAKQLRYIRNIKHGYIKENVLIIQLKENGAISKAEELKENILKYNKIISVTLSDSTPLKMGMSIHNLKIEDDQGSLVEMDIQRANIDYDFFATYGIELAKGRSHSKYNISDKQCVVVNESFIKRIGWKNPFNEKIKNSPVIGVVKDYHFDTLYKNIEPAAFYFSSVFLGEIEVGVKYRAGDLSGTIGNIKNIYNRLIDSQPFEYYFLDQEFDGIYQDENRLFQLLRYFQAISAMISGMGLYGLATYAIHKRKKEIGIRKFLGASTAKIVKIFYKEIFILVLIADFIALPLGFYLTKKWLDNFYYRCHLGFEPFVFAIISTLMISIIASSIQIFKAINANPIESIRYEW